VIRSILFALFVMCFWPSAGWAGVFNPTTYTLDNGATLVVIEKPNVPVAVHMAWYGAGSVDDPKGKSGLAHVLEHMMFRGTKTLKDGEFSDRIAAMGGTHNAFTSREFTAYYQKVPLASLEEVMGMEASRMRALAINQEKFETEINVVLQERAMRVESRIKTQMAEKLAETLYQGHPFAVPVIGHEDDIKALKVADLMAFYDTFYQPENLTILVAGAAPPDKVYEMAQKTYGQYSAGQNSGKHTSPVPDSDLAVMPQLPQKKTTLYKRDPAIGLARVSRYYLAPSYAAGETHHALALEVLAEMLGNAATGRLYQDFVVDKEIASSLSVRYDPMTEGPAAFAIHLTPLVPLAEAEGALSEFLYNFQPTEEEVEATIAHLTGEVAFVRDSLFNGAYLLGSVLAAGLPVEVIETWPEKVSNVTQKDVENAYAHIFGQQPVVKLQLLPKYSTLIDAK